MHSGKHLCNSHNTPHLAASAALPCSMHTSRAHITSRASHTSTMHLCRRQLRAVARAAPRASCAPPHDDALCEVALDVMSVVVGEPVVPCTLSTCPMIERVVDECYRSRMVRLWCIPCNDGLQRRCHPVALPIATIPNAAHPFDTGTVQRV